MKMSTEHYASLLTSVSQFAHQIPAYAEQLKVDPRVNDIETRLLFDAFHATKIYSKYSYQSFNYSDRQIKTAMRRIFRELGIKPSIN